MNLQVVNIEMDDATYHDGDRFASACAKAQELATSQMCVVNIIHHDHVVCSCLPEGYDPFRNDHSA